MKPIFYTHHSDASVWGAHYCKEIRAVKYLMRHYRMKIIALHQEMRKKIEAVLGNRHNDSILVLHNGVDVNRFVMAKNKKTVRKELGIGEETFVVGHVGRFDPVKNHAYILKVFREIKKRRKDALLLLVGSGEEGQRILKQSMEYGFHDSLMILSRRTDVHHLLKGMDVMLFPSFFEGSPIALIEAQFSGLKCLVSDTISKEIAFSNLIRFKSIEEHPGTWAEALLEWKDEGVRYENSDDWNLDTIVRRLEDCYTETDW